MDSKELLPKRTVANVFIIWRVPRTMGISKITLLDNIRQDIKSAYDSCSFSYSFYARRETPERTLRFMLQRKLLTEKSGLIIRNKRTARYISKLSEIVVELVDTLPICDPLILLAGAGD
jgi:hypothetical protein